MCGIEGCSFTQAFKIQASFQTSPQTALVNAMQKSADFVRAFLLGFEVRV